MKDFKSKHFFESCSNFPLTFMLLGCSNTGNTLELTEDELCDAMSEESFEVVEIFNA